MSGEKSLRIDTIKDATLRALAQKYDTGDKKGILEGEELIAFNKAKAKYKPENRIVIKINDVKVLKTPQTVLNTRNILTVIENYEKDHDGHTLLGDFIKDDEIPREQRKSGAIKTFEILYEKVLTGAKTEFQKQELRELKERFNQVITEEMDNSWFEWGISTSEINKIVSTMQKLYTTNTKELAGEIYDHADNNNFSYADNDFKYLLNSIDSGNAISVAQQVKNHPKNTDKETLLQVLAQEFTMPFSNEQKAEKQAQIKNFVNSYIKAAGYQDTPYMPEVQKLLNSILNSTDTGSLLFTSDIKKLDSILDSFITNKPKDIATKIYQIIDENSFAFDRTDLKILLDKINPSNVNEILKEFKNNPDKKSLLTMIDEEWGNGETRESYINKIVKTQLQATKFAKDKKINEHINNSLKNESTQDIELLMNSLGKNKDTKFMSKTIYEALSEDEDNIDKEFVKYLLNGIDKSNVTKFMEDFKKLSGGKPITEYFQENGETTAQEYLLSITDSLLEANKAKFDNENFNATFGILKTDVEKYIRKNIKDKEDISRVVNSLLRATPSDIAKNIEDIASDKYGAADDISFKLWISKIDKTNARAVIKEYKEKYDGNTPINAIIEEYTSNVGERQSQVLHVLSSLVSEIGEDRVNPGNISDFNERLEKELFGFGPAGAKKLNKLLTTITAGIPEKGETLIADNSSNISTLENVRPDIETISLGEKYGNFSWQYSNIKNIKSLEDISDLTGLSMDYIEEMLMTEGYREEAYICSSDKKTIGIGHNFHNAPKAEKEYLETATLSESEIYQIFAYDLINAINRLKNNRGIDTSKLTQGQYEALVDVSFNAPGYMKTLSEKTNKAIAIKEQNPLKTEEAFDKAAYEFNQQLSNSKISAGLCKRRIRNVLRYCEVNSFKELPPNSEAQKRIIILAKNGYNATPIIKKLQYIEQICNLLNITEEEFKAFEYPKDYEV